MSRALLSLALLVAVLALLAPAQARAARQQQALQTHEDAVSAPPGGSNDDGAAPPSGEGEEDDENGAEGSDQVQGLVSQALAGEPLTINGQPASDGSGPTIALGNKNLLIKETDASDDEQQLREEKVKKTAEAGKKSYQEQIVKYGEEEANKEKAVLQEKQRLEEKNKRADDELHRKGEQHTKTSREEMAKANEADTKQLESVQREHARIVSKNQRDEQLLKEKSKAAEAENKRLSELNRKKAAEEIEKKNKDATEAVQKATAAAEQTTKKAETDAKEANTKTEAAEKKKAAEKKAEEAQKAAADGQWCDCTSHRVPFQSYSQWMQCPDQYLVTGIFRDNTDYLNGIIYYQCCRPCRMNGQRLSLYNCQQANWWSSFDSPGWSWCPDGTYIQGLWKNSCDWIYCIEWAYCCGINGSRGRKSCTSKTSWGSSMDGYGWSVLDKNQFIAGLYRSDQHYLHNIEYASQCVWWAT